MTTTSKQIHDFFDAYEARFNSSLQTGKVDAQGIANCFAKNFIEASPAGVNCGKNNLFFRWMIPRGYAHYRKIGTRSMKILSKMITTIDAYHSMVNVRWTSTYTRNKDKKEITIDFNVIYMVQHITSEMKIFAYVTGDEQGVLKQHELI